jgi:hypothetical protein
MLLLPPPPPYSMYARNVIARGPDVTGRELDRLQRKIVEAQRAVSRMNGTGLLEAHRILHG